LQRVAEREAQSAAAVLLQGWVPLDVLAQHMRTKPSLDEIKRVVADNDKVHSPRLWLLFVTSLRPGVPEASLLEGTNL
jgi:hypothetical protein